MSLEINTYKESNIPTLLKQMINCHEPLSPLLPCLVHHPSIDDILDELVESPSECKMEEVSKKVLRNQLLNQLFLNDMKSMKEGQLIPLSRIEQYISTDRKQYNRHIISIYKNTLRYMAWHPKYFQQHQEIAKLRKQLNSFIDTNMVLYDLRKPMAERAITIPLYLHKSQYARQMLGLQ